jgi:hypothetical protein
LNLGIGELRNLGIRIEGFRDWGIELGDLGIEEFRD